MMQFGRIRGMIPQIDFRQRIQPPRILCTDFDHILIGDHIMSTVEGSAHDTGNDIPFLVSADECFDLFRIGNITMTMKIDFHD